jgi:TPR-repeat-containing protein cell-adhesion domain protein (fragment)
MKIDNYFIRMLSILRLKSIFSVIVLLLLLSGNIFAQQKVFKTQGIPRPEQKIQNDNKSQSQKVKESSARDNTFTFDNIEFWVGEGENRAALIVDWYDDGETAMVWGFRWNGEATGLDMIKAIAKADPRFLLLTQLTNLGNTIAGLGYSSSQQDINITYDLEGVKKDPKINFKFDKPNQSLGQHSCPANPMEEINTAIQEGKRTGVIDHPFNYAKYGYACYDYDYWKCTQSDVKWRAAWYHEGYWSYLTKDDVNKDFVYSGVGATLRKLTNGSWDSWGFQKGWESWTGVEPREPFQAVKPPKASRANVGDIAYRISNTENTSSDLSISYNPVAETINIKSAAEGKAMIYSIGGNAVMSVTVNRGENSIQASHLAQGVYIVRFMDKSVKIIKQ